MNDIVLVNSSWILFGLLAITVTVAALTTIVVGPIVDRRRRRLGEKAAHAASTGGAATAPLDHAVVAAIVAAINAAAGSRRVVYCAFGEQPACNWTSVVRTQHHMLHMRQAIHRTAISR